MVGRLIQNNQFRFSNQNICQSDTLQLPTRKAIHLLVVVMDFQFSQDLFGTLLIVPSLQAVHPLQQFIDFRGVFIHQSLLIFGQQLHCLVLGIETCLQNGQAGRILGCLLQITNTQVIAKDNRTGIIVLLSGYDVQQCRLSGTVLGYQAYFLSLSDTESDILKQNMVTKTLCQIVYLKKTYHLNIVFRLRR